MIDARDTQRLVGAGVFSLGIPIGGPATGRDVVDQCGRKRPGNLPAMMVK